MKLDKERFNLLYHTLKGIKSNLAIMTGYLDGLLKLFTIYLQHQGIDEDNEFFRKALDDIKVFTR